MGGFAQRPDPGSSVSGLRPKWAFDTKLAYDHDDVGFRRFQSLLYLVLFGHLVVIVCICAEACRRSCSTVYDEIVIGANGDLPRERHLRRSRGAGPSASDCILGGQRSRLYLP